MRLVIKAEAQSTFQNPKWPLCHCHFIFSKPLAFLLPSKKQEESEREREKRVGVKGKVLENRVTFSEQWLH